MATGKGKQASETPRQRLARHMNDRRLDLGMTWKEVADKGELTTETLRQIRFGEGDIRDLTKRGIERALEWTPGTLDAIVRGRSVPPPTPAPDVDTRMVERVGDDLALMSLLLRSGLSEHDELSVVMYIRARRAQQYDDLVKEVRSLVKDMGGTPPPNDLPYGHLAN